MEDITFSLFKGYADTLPADATLNEIIRMIRQDPAVEERTQKYRYYSKFPILGCHLLDGCLLAPV